MKNLTEIKATLVLAVKKDSSLLPDGFNSFNLPQAAFILAAAVNDDLSADEVESLSHDLIAHEFVSSKFNQDAIYYICNDDSLYLSSNGDPMLCGDYRDAVADNIALESSDDEMDIQLLELFNATAELKCD